VTSRGRLLVKLVAGQSVALGAVLVVVRAVGVERAALVPARGRGWVTAGGGLAAYAAITAAIRCETLARRPRSRRWITGEFAAVEAINPDGILETMLYLPVALQAAVLEELLFRGLLPTALARGGLAYLRDAGVAAALRARPSLPGTGVPDRFDDGDRPAVGRGRTDRPLDPARDRATRRA